MNHIRSLFCLAAMVFTATGCPDPDPSITPETPETPIACERTRDCPVDQVCDVEQGECVPDLACASHAECGADAYCDDGECARSTTGVACDTSDDCYAADECFAGHCGCAGESILPERIAPNVTIVLDRSGSMDDSGGADTKWNLATAAVETMVNDYGNDIRFGLVLYNSDDECGAGDIDVAVGTGTAGDIIAAMAATSPDGSTPIGATLDALRNYTGLQDPDRDNAIVLLTDGEETCDGDPVSAANALRMAPRPVRTFAIGFGDGVDADSLDAIAEAGGTDARDNGHRYYHADDASSLMTAFDDIATTVIGCTFQLPAAPTDASQLFVYFGDEELPASEYSYDPDTEQLTFAGASCQALATGTRDQFSFARGCPPYVP